MAQSYDRDYYDSHINEEIDIDIYQNRETFGLLDKDGFLIIDLNPGQHYANQNDEKAMERYEFSTNDMRVTIDGYGNIVLPDGTIAKEEMSHDYLDHSVEFEIDRVVNFWNDAKDDPTLVYDLNPDDFTFSLTRLQADRDTDRTHELYTTAKVEAYDKDRGILILNSGENNQRYFSEIDIRADEQLVKFNRFLTPISPEEAYNGGINGRDVLVPKQEISINILRMGQNYDTQIARFENNEIEASQISPENCNRIHVEPSRTDVFRVEGCSSRNDLRPDTDAEPRYEIVLTSLSDNSTHVLSPNYSFVPATLESLRQGFSREDLDLEPIGYAEVSLPVDSRGDIIIVPNVNEYGNPETFSNDFFSYNPSEGITVNEDRFYEKDRDWDRDYDWGPSDGRDDPELP